MPLPDTAPAPRATQRAGLRQTRVREQVAQLRGMEPAEVAALTTATAARFFNWRTGSVPIPQPVTPQSMPDARSKAPCGRQP